ncbi:hypothetical protein G7Y89_g13208 [Cudoniella acicularis]|uniref:Uncharacterized protein n=1 Tax=Cudoniella acicularis TaxID=354080 RepID=A0A8H4R9S0_9HELO|nr:hypothetical protein G7Y89_g13208 [Cudoniella acicularis]
MSLQKLAGLKAEELSTTSLDDLQVDKIKQNPEQTQKGFLGIAEIVQAIFSSAADIPDPHVCLACFMAGFQVAAQPSAAVPLSLATILKPVIRLNEYRQHDYNEPIYREQERAPTAESIAPLLWISSVRIPYQPLNPFKPNHTDASYEDPHS